MSYNQPLSNQVIIFIYSVGFGVLLGFVYEVFSVLRMLLSDKKWAYILCDSFFSLSATVSSFFFMVLFNSGVVRFNLIAAQLIGGLVFHFSMGKYFIKPLMFIAEKLRKFVYIFLSPIRFFLKKSAEYLLKWRKKAKNKKIKKIKPEKEKKKIKNIIKIPLKNCKK